MFLATLTAMRCYGAVAGLLLLTAAPAVAAAEDFFADIAVSTDSFNAPARNDKWLIKQLFSYGFNSPGPGFSRQESGFNKVETSVRGAVSHRFSERLSGRLEWEFFHDAIYRLSNDIQPTTQEIATFENRHQARDIYLDIDVSRDWHLRLGNQVISWGYSEASVIADVIAPFNNYTLLQADLKNLRLHVPAAHLSYNQNNLTLDIVLTHNAGFNQLAPAANEFDPYFQLRQLPQQIQQHKATNKTEYFVRLKRQFYGGDISLIVADANSNELSLQAVSDDALIFGQQRQQSLALAGNVGTGLWIYKAELGIHKNNAVAPRAEFFSLYTDGWPLRDQVLAMAGFDYAGFTNTTLSFELNYQYSRGQMAALATDKNQYGAMASVLWNDVNDRLNLKASAISLLNNDGRVFRFNIEYPFSDSLKLGGLLVYYDFGNNDVLSHYRDNDVVQLYVQYDF